MVDGYMTHRLFLPMAAYFFPQITWRGIPTQPQPTIYLTFDDGPTSVTPWVLAQLRQYNAQATFFCIGQQVEKYPDLYKQILVEGHQVGNHTYQHLNGWKTANEIYYQNIRACSELVDSPLFRPPYGRLRPAQIRQILEGDLLAQKANQIINYDVISYDFDLKMSGEACWKIVQRYSKNGSIILFHDMPKAWDRLQFVLPQTLATFTQLGFDFKAISHPKK